MAPLSCEPSFPMCRSGTTKRRASQRGAEEARTVPHGTMIHSLSAECNGPSQRGPLQAPAGPGLLATVDARRGRKAPRKRVVAPAWRGRPRHRCRTVPVIPAPARLLAWPCPRLLAFLDVTCATGHSLGPGDRPERHDRRILAASGLLESPQGHALVHSGVDGLEGLGTPVPALGRPTRGTHSPRRRTDPADTSMTPRR